MKNVKFTDYGTVIYHKNDDSEVRISRKNFYKRIHKLLKSYIPKVKISYNEKNELLIDDTPVEYDEEFKANEVQDPNSEFNKKMNELIKIYNESMTAGYQSESIEDALSKLKFFKQKRFIFKKDARNHIVFKRNYILDHLDKDSEEYKIQIKEKIKDLKSFAIIKTIMGLSFFYPLILAGCSFIFSFNWFFKLIFSVIGGVDILFALAIASEGDPGLISFLAEAKNDMVDIKGYKEKLKHLKNKTIYKPLAKKQEEQEKKEQEIKDALSLVDIITRVEKLKIQLQSSNTPNNQALFKRLTDAIKEYTNNRDDYKKNPDKVDIASSKRKLLSELKSIENDVKQLLEQQTNKISQLDIELAILKAQGEEILSSQESVPKLSR